MKGSNGRIICFVGKEGLTNNGRKRLIMLIKEKEPYQTLRMSLVWLFGYYNATLNPYPAYVLVLSTCGAHGQHQWCGWHIKF